MFLAEEGDAFGGGRCFWRGTEVSFADDGGFLGDGSVFVDHMFLFFIYSLEIDMDK